MCALVISKVDYCCSVLDGISGHLSKLQSVLNAAARLIFSARRSDHTTPLLCELHWLRIQFRLCVLSYCCLHGTAPSFLADGHRHLCLSVTDVLFVTSTNHSTLGDRAFSVAVSEAWNGLSASVRTATSMSTFRQQLCPCNGCIV